MIPCGICLSLSDFILLGIVLSKSTHVAADGKISFFFMTEEYSTIYTCVHIYVHTHIFIRSSVDGYLHCSHILAIINNTTMNIGMHNKSLSELVNVFEF